MRRPHPSVFAATFMILVGLVATWAADSGTAESASDPGELVVRGGSSAAAVTDPGESVETSTNRALDALSAHVRRQSHPDALRLAFQAYYTYADAHPAEIRNPYFFYVDYGLDNRTARGYVFEMETLTLVDGPFTVSHGSGSSTGRNGVPTRFTNQPGSYTSSLGLYLTQETYRFTGKSGGRGYTSVGLRMKGLSGPFNSAARRRGIVSHGAPYVTAGDAGRSQGCPAMEQRRARRLLPMIAGGGLVFLFSPRDERWLREGPWVTATR